MTESKVGKGKKVSRIIYLLLCALFAVGIVLQVALAGMAIFMNGLHWNHHSMLIHLFGFNIPIAMLVVAIFGKMPRWAYWQVFGLLLLMFLMYFTANITAVFSIVSALHPVVAMGLFIFSIWTVHKAWKFSIVK